MAMHPSAIIGPMVHYQNNVAVGLPRGHAMVVGLVGTPPRLKQLRRPYPDDSGAGVVELIVPDPELIGHELNQFLCL